MINIIGVYSATALSRNEPLSHSHHERHHLRIVNRDDSIDELAGLANAETTLFEGMKAIVLANRLRLQNPQRNRYEFRNASEILGSREKAPPLSYGKDNKFSNNSRNLDESSSSDHKTADSPKGSYAYTLPKELVTAARVMAELNPQQASIPQLPTSLMSISGTNDTSVMAQALAYPDGLHGWAPSRLPSLYNAQKPAQHTNIKRESSTFWMRSIEQNGQSPFAPTGYQVWRNVMDYGAAGDGLTDDTEAINAAISYGGRCGIDCGSSTIYPATVFFPPGVYLVSSPIIQYYNTEILGDPTDLPMIIAASSFVGLGVITSDVYIGTTEGWYLNTNNFLRSIKNFIMDITRTQLNAQVCAIHWQVAQGTSLENIHFVMSSEEGSTQQGIYMENGSGGWLSDLTFVGGMFGAYFGNQQFTSRNLAFDGCKTALQISWDWAWTMQGINIKNCGTGINVVGEAGGSLGTSKNVGSLTLLDLVIENTPIGIETSLFSTNSTSLLIENAYLNNVSQVVTNNQNAHTLLAGSSDVTTIDSWGFGMMTNASGVENFASAQKISQMSRSASLVDQSGNQTTPSPKFFTRRRPVYTNIGFSQIIDVTTYGAVGDGQTDDTAALNSIFALAANMSSIVFIPFGVYKIFDTVHIPVGSRIVGQAWSQIMATGDKFQDINNPRVAVQVGNSGDIGVIEIQDMMFTVSGPTAGAILVEWNVHEIIQGSVGMWDTHIRVGGAIGSDLQLADCPKLSGEINSQCVAASLLFHMTPKSSGYIENSWMWVADHDMDVVTQDLIDVYSGRGLLIESQGPTWLYGTAVEHNILYQYQVSGAKDILMGVIQTESPYFQVAPAAPNPFTSGLGLFANDPTFSDCKPDSLSCAVSWAIRIIDSVSIYVLGAGLYSWFQQYEQTCLATESCQDRIFSVEQSTEIWVYNLVTKGSTEMVSPVNGVATFSLPNQGGTVASLLAWLEGADQTIGIRTFTGFQLYKEDFVSALELPNICVTALTASIHCNSLLATYTTPQWAGSLENDTLTDSVCDPGCGSSLAFYFNTVSSSCAGYNITGAPPAMLGGFIWQGYNETCLKDPASGHYCNDLILDFTLVSDVSEMPRDEMCSTCYTQRLKMMQSSQYSAYAGTYSSILAYVAEACSLGSSTDILPPLIEETPSQASPCVSGNYYTTSAGDTCDTISLAHNVSSASLFIGNAAITNCANIIPATNLCLPIQCQRTYALQPNDTCGSLESTYNLGPFGLRGFNPWITFDCTGLQQSSTVYGTILCLSPPGGTYNPSTVTSGHNTNPFNNDPYSTSRQDPPVNSTIANGTTLNCGVWYTAAPGDDCPILSIFFGLTAGLLMQINPSLPSQNCSYGIMANITYCISPIWAWDTTPIESDTMDAAAYAEASAAASVSWLASWSAAQSAAQTTMESSAPTSSQIQNVTVTLSSSDATTST
ncbi:hypothetical protein BELL_0097g00130 [Botrytis elliptica]|uniref:LysM domain-containing protein n=1 Tax=Botrytis elliptica TaxID=278938 RepID=A0A4Z1JUX0_9HELO|nr:hypothetical protein BELL_0097g00130 [Botrytis elliptica]